MIPISFAYKNVLGTVSDRPHLCKSQTITEPRRIPEKGRRSVLLSGFFTVIETMGYHKHSGCSLKIYRELLPRTRGEQAFTPHCVVTLPTKVEGFFNFFFLNTSNARNKNNRSVQSTEYIFYLLRNIMCNIKCGI